MKKIFSYLFALCLVFPCAFMLTGCKKIKSYAFYLDDKVIEDSTLNYKYGDDIEDVLDDVELEIKAKKETLDYDLDEIDFVLKYDNFSTTTTLNSLPTEWNAGTYTFECTVETKYGTVETSLVLNIAQVAKNVSYTFEINESQTETEWEYDRSPLLGNDPIIKISRVGADPEDETVYEYKAYYLSSSKYTSFSQITKNTEKIKYLKNNAKLYNGSYGLIPNTYYLVAVVDNGQNHIDTCTNAVKCTVTRESLDLSHLIFNMDYTFNPSTLTGDYVTLDQVVEEVGMPSLMDFDGDIVWNEDYSDLQIKYSSAKPTVDLRVKLVPNDPYVDYSQTEFDCILTLHQALIKIPTKAEEFPRFAYQENSDRTPIEQGITLANAPDYFNDWLTEDALKFVTGNFETHVNAGDYILTLNLANNPNIAFSQDGETASNETSVSFNWSISKAYQRVYLNGLEKNPIRIDEDTEIEADITLDANNSWTLPTITPFENPPYVDGDPIVKIETTDARTTGAGTIEDNKLVVTSSGIIVVSITKQGSSNVNSTTITLVLNCTSQNA